MKKIALVPALVLVLAAMLPFSASLAGNDLQLAERLQRHHEAPPARPGDEQSSPRQDRARDQRGERPRRSGDQEPSDPEADSRWSTHGAPETGADEDADDDADDDRIYFERYP